VRLVTSGWVGLVRLLFDGRRQVLQLALAGDLIHAPVSRGDHVMALTSARSVDASGVRRAAEKEQGSALQRAWRLAEHDAHCELLAQIARLGAMSAHERTANWIAELMRRHARAGLGDGRWMPWPVTQEIVADVLGLSIVHVNRVLQQLRRDGLIQLRAGMLHVPEPELLAGAGLVESA
jgi:CRP-like cAMP-binding protein